MGLETNFEQDPQEFRCPGKFKKQRLDQQFSTWRLWNPFGKEEGVQTTPWRDRLRPIENIDIYNS